MSEWVGYRRFSPDGASNVMIDRSFSLEPPCAALPLLVTLIVSGFGVDSLRLPNKQFYVEFLAPIETKIQTAAAELGGAFVLAFGRRATYTIVSYLPPGILFSDKIADIVDGALGAKQHQDERPRCILAQKDDPSWEIYERWLPRKGDAILYCESEQ